MDVKIIPMALFGKLAGIHTIGQHDPKVRALAVVRGDVDGAVVLSDNLMSYEQADPFPSNIFVMPEDVICLLDFGMLCAMVRATREIFVAPVELS